MEDKKLVSDKDIIKGIQRGGEERDKMFNILVLQTQSLLHAYLIKKLRISIIEDRSDIITDSYMSVDKQIGEAKFRGEMSLKNYLHIVVARKANDFFRSRANRPEEGAADEVQIDVYNTFNAETMDFSDEKAEEDCVKKSFETFQKKYPKDVVKLWEYTQGYSHEEYANRNGGSAGSSRDRLCTIKKKLKKILDRLCGEERK